MERTALKGFTVTDVTVVNHKQNSERIELENSYSYNMKIISPTRCIGEFKISVKDKKAPETFSVSAVCGAVFDYAEGKPHTELHMETMAGIFPYVKSFITTLTANMGILPIIIPEVDFGNISIVNVQIPPK